MKSISVIMATLNSGDILDSCLSSISNQNYNQDKIEIIAADGGSTDNTLEILNKYNAVVIPENTGSPEAAKGVALRKTSNELILEVDEDNILPNKNWLKRMVECFDKEPDIVGCYPWRYAHQWDDKPLNRYFSLFGVNDPVAYFMGKADRQDYLPPKGKYKLAGKAVDKGRYFLVEFTPENLPTVGGNGFLIKRDLLMKAKVNPEHFFHIDVNMDLVKQGLNKYAVVKNNIIHASGEKFLKYFKKRYRYWNELYQQDDQYRRYSICKFADDSLMIVLYSLYSLSIVGPLAVSFIGFLSLPDPAWFLHPLVCMGIFWIYFVSVLKSWYRRIFL